MGFGYLPAEELVVGVARGEYAEERAVQQEVEPAVLHHPLPRERLDLVGRPVGKVPAVASEPRRETTYTVISTYHRGG